MRGRLLCLCTAVWLGCARAPAPPPHPPAGPVCAARLCDDFEAYGQDAPPAGPWTVQASPGESARVDGTRAFSGRRSVLIHHSGTAHDFVYLRLGAPALPLAGNDLHGRLMLFVTQAPPRLHWDVVRASGRRPDGAEAQYNVGGENARFLSNYEPHDCWRRSARPFPQGRWVCLQWQFDGSGDHAGGTRNELRVWLDGQQVEDATVQRFGGGCVDKTTSEWIAPRFDTLDIGWEQYRRSDPITMWIDDVAVGDAAIACPAPPP